MLWILPDSQNPIPIPCTLMKGESITSDGTWVKLVSSSQQFFFSIQKPFNFCGQTYYVGRRPPPQFKRVLIQAVLIVLPVVTIASAFPISMSRMIEEVSFSISPAKSFDSKTTQKTSEKFVSEALGSVIMEEKQISLPVPNKTLRKVAAPSDAQSAIDPMRCSPIPKISSRDAAIGTVDHSKQQEENWFVCR